MNDDWLTRCTGCDCAVIAPLLEAGEPPDTLYCTLMGYPCDMIKICDKTKISKEEYDDNRTAL